MHTGSARPVTTPLGLNNGTLLTGHSLRLTPIVALRQLDHDRELSHEMLRFKDAFVRER